MSTSSSSSSSSPATPGWLKSLPLAPEFRPSDTEFSDPIAFISRIEREASAFGICKIIPPTPKSPSKKFALSNLSRSLGPSPFTTRHQQLGHTRTARHQQVWQSGEFYTLDQFESKSRTFSKSYLHTSKPVPALSVETRFWKAAAEKPIYVEYANDVPGSGFSPPRKRRREFLDTGPDGISNSPWNLQVIARAPGSLTRFMPDDIPGVTSPMVYVAMLFSWFAWHVEDHELHSLNFLHVGAPKTWYAVPADRAEEFEEAVRVKGYGADVDRLEAFRMLGEKTTLLSPEVVVASGIPCCRLVQNPGEFVVTFPRAYHIGFSHGFNCGEAANFATPQWLNVAKEAAVRRAAMSYLPMLSHQQLLYILTMSFVTRVPRALLSGVRSSRLKDRKREEREILVKKAFLNDIMTENNLLCVLLSKESTSYAVLWEPDLLPSPCTVSQSHSFVSLEAQGSGNNSDDQGREKKDGCVKVNLTGSPAGVPQIISSIEEQKNACCLDSLTSDEELLEGLDADEDDLPVGLKIDSGTLPCVACGILGYPFMAVVQPSALACKELFPVNYEQSHQNIGKSSYSGPPSCLPSSGCKFEPEKTSSKLGEQANPDSSQKSSPECSGHVPIFEGNGKRDGSKLPNSDVEPPNLSDEQISGIGNVHFSNKSKKIEKSYGIDCLKELKGGVNMTDRVVEVDTCTSSCGMKPFPEINKLHDTVPRINNHHSDKNSGISNEFLRPRIFCLEHALEIEELLRCKGGAHVLIICHSDYVKIKAYAMSVAEEVRMQFNFEDVPLGNASPSDLDLINISIGDEEHDEHGEDWTSKLGMNLRYSVKVRSQSVSKQKRLSVVLGRMFSDNFLLSDFSTLKWQRRKLRTPYKVVGASLSKSFIDVNIEKGGSVVRNTNASSTVKLQVYQSRRRKSAIKYFDHLRKSIPDGMGGSNGSAAVDDMENCQKSGQIHQLDEKVDVDKPNELFTVPISATEDLQMYKDSCLPVVASNLEKVSDPCRFKSCHQDVNLPILETSETHQENSSAQDYEGWCSSRTSLKSECQVNSVERKASNTEVQQQTGSAVETNPGREFNNISYGESEIVQDTSVSRELNLDGSLCNYLLPVNQSHDNSEVQAEVSVPGKPNMVARVDHSSKAKKRFSVKEFDTKCKVGSSEKPESQDNVLEPEVKVSDVQLKATATVIGSSQQERHNVLDSSRGSETFQDNPEMQLEVLTAETPNMQVNVEQSTKLEGQYASSCSTVEKSGMQEKEFLAPEENNVQGGGENSQFDSGCRTGMPMANSSQPHQGIHSTSERNKELVSFVNPVLDNRSVNTANTIASSVSMEAEMNTMGGLKRCNRNLGSVGIKAYFRRRYKRKREEELVAEAHPSCKSFTRSPCEGLRPRSRRIPAPEITDTRIMEKKAAASVTKKLGKETAASVTKKLGKETTASVTKKLGKEAVASVTKKLGKYKDNKTHMCDIKGCRMGFRTRGELQLHMQNRCTHKGCRKQFKSHKNAMQHQRVHLDVRPLKCPWKGCEMSFKWDWSRTEHMRLHTGERPYKCTVAGCGMTFRFVSAFSSHRRKTGHTVNSTDQ